MSSKPEDATDAEMNAADTADSGDRDASVTYVCPDCGAPMIIIETFLGGQLPRAPPVRWVDHDDSLLLRILPVFLLPAGHGKDIILPVASSSALLPST
jgi:hypothetical protein